MAHQIQEPAVIFAAGSSAKVRQVAGTRYSRGVCHPSRVQIRSKRTPDDGPHGKRLQLRYQRAGS